MISVIITSNKITMTKQNYYSQTPRQFDKWNWNKGLLSSGKKNKFDKSDYSENSKLTDEKGIGEFKDEAAGEIITEFIGLRSKMYSYIKDNRQRQSRRLWLVKDIIHEDYQNTLFNNKQMYHKMKIIRSDHHQHGSYELNKARSCFDDKRYIGPIYTGGTGGGSSIWNELGQRTVARLIIRLRIRRRINHPHEESR